MAKCRHRQTLSFVYRVAGGDVMSWFSCASFEKPDATICQNPKCGAWLSLGPSNDAPAEVQQEIRAVQLATTAPCEPGIGPDIKWAPTEWLGWRLHEDCNDDPEVAPRSIGEERGWLAREICLHYATHDDGGES